MLGAGNQEQTDRGNSSHKACSIEGCYPAGLSTITSKGRSGAEQ